MTGDPEWQYLHLMLGFLFPKSRVNQVRIQNNKFFMTFIWWSTSKIFILAARMHRMAPAMERLWMIQQRVQEQHRIHLRQDARHSRRYRLMKYKLIWNFFKINCISLIVNLYFRCPHTNSNGSQSTSSVCTNCQVRNRGYYYYPRSTSGSILPPPQQPMVYSFPESVPNRPGEIPHRVWIINYPNQYEISK